MRAAAPALLAALVALAAASCGGSGSEPAPTATPEATATAAAPVPSATPMRPLEGGYRPVRTLDAVSFDHMDGFVVMPGGSEAVVLTQEGAMWRVALDGSGEPAPFADFSTRLIAQPGREEGLLGLAFPPDYAANPRAYVHYTAGGPRRGVIAWFPVREGALDLSEEHLVLEVPQPFANHNGGQLVFGPDGYLYVTLGDGGAAGDPQGNAQNPTTLYGSILRLDVSAEPSAVPPDNPFAAGGAGRPEVYAFGFRNPWRMSFDRETGELWTGDVGQDQWEEVDRVEAGGNYGWNVLESFTCYNADTCDTAGFIAPRAAYSHDEGCAVIGGFVYRGTALPELSGWYVYGDFCSGQVWAVNTADESEPVLLFESDLTISSFGELPDGELVLVSYEDVENGVYRLARAE